MSIEERIEDTCHLVVVGLIATAFLPWDEAPAVGYWATIGPIAWLAGSLLAVVLSMLDIGMKDWPRLGRFGFMMVVVTVLFLGAWNEAEQAEEAATLRTDLNKLHSDLIGESNYAYIRSRGGQKSKEGFLLSINADSYIPGVSIELYSLGDDGKKTIVGRGERRVDIQDETANFGPPLGIGKWEYDFRSRFSNWNQVLILKEGDGVLTETIEVRHRGETNCLRCETQTYPIKETP